MAGRWQFWIDRGGTFTDCLGVDPEGGPLRVAKVLSSDAAPLQGIRALLGVAAGAPIAACDIRMGTTLATNALLERRGTATGLLISQGFGDLLRIGDQSRPHIFQLDIQRPEPLYRAVREVDARADAEGRVLREPDETATRRALRELRDAGCTSLAVVLLHAYRAGELERRILPWAEQVGFEHVSLSHVVAAEMGMLGRGDTSVLDAYLTPIIHHYVKSLLRELPGSSLRLMQSSGGLTDARRFRGRNAVLSGPAGGVVACARIAEEMALGPVIGFDMGGTSTDVCRHEGEFDRVYETRVAGVRLRAPMMNIHTVAAGGGSICRYDAGRFVVGPQSAGAHPGPLCYGDEGATQLALTDVNLLLGRLRGDRFPFPLAPERARAALARIADTLAAQGDHRSVEQVAEGFFHVAVEHMAEAIRKVSVARGYDVREHTLIVFGGAGGQHACPVARRLGIRRVLVHPQGGVLSAYGMGVADVSWHGEADAGREALKHGWSSAIEGRYARLESDGMAAMEQDGFERGRLRLERRADLRYRGTESALTLFATQTDDLRDRFEQAHRQRFGYAREGHVIEVVTVRLQVVAPGPRPVGGKVRSGPRETAPSSAEMWVDGALQQVPVLRREALRVGEPLRGPALVLESTATLVVDPGFELELDAQDRIVLTDREGERSAAGTATEVEPVTLEVFNNLFMSIAEQMGVVLQRTALSTNIRERLDFSCAVFDGEGGLVANAPHIPVHLGAMGESVRAVLQQHPSPQRGDVFATNDPAMGGSHIPDVTVITPVFGRDRRPLFFTASRGHHADIGGITPGSMPPFSTRLDQEGVVLRGLPIVRDGVLDEVGLRQLLGAGPHPARDPDQNIADLEAQIAANRTGQVLLDALCTRYSTAVVKAYMGHVQDNAAACVERALAALPDGEYRFADRLDDGTPIAVRIAVKGSRMHLDFSGSGPQVASNANAPRAVTVAAVLYVVRCMVGEPIPLNSGCLRPIELSIPHPSVLWPGADAAVVAGNVETSQRVVDVLLGALGRQAACQGTMNNLTFGDASFGYYETIAGGSGAGPHFDGLGGVHTHMTNTRITDPEVLETRFPVRLLRFSLRPGSAGAGAHRGGDGVIRELQALRPLSFSILSERRDSAPFGLQGGEPGAPGRNFHNDRTLPGRVRFEAATGDRVRIETPGGGGYGPRSDL